MATSGALSGFLSAMLQLRSQRLQEQEDKARAQAELMSGIGEGLGAIGKGVGSAMKQGREDQTYNQLMNRMSPPSATAVDPAMQAKFTGEVGAPHTGGKTEFNALQDQMELESKVAEGKKADIWKALAYNQRERALNIQAGKAVAASEVAKQAAQNKAFEGMSKSAQDIVKDSDAYRKTAPGFLEDMRKAQEAKNGQGDFAAWKVAADNLASMNDMAKGRKLVTPLVDVPPFFPLAQQKLLNQLDVAQKAAQGAPATSGLFGRPSPEALALTEAGTAATGVSVPYPSGKPRYAPPNTPLNPEMINRLAGGAQATPEEAKQLGVTYPGGGGGPTAAPAPGAAPLARRNPQTGQISVWNSQAGKWEIK